MRRLPFFLILLLAHSVSSGAPAAQKTNILFVVGPSNHGPGTHEVEAGTRLLKACLDTAIMPSSYRTEISTGWPSDRRTLAHARTIVFMGDGFPPYRFANAHEIFSQLELLVADGCSLVCIHYATSVNDSVEKPVPTPVKASLFEWLGGFGHFLPGNAQPGTQARILPVNVTPTSTGHPVVRGVKPFSFRDEPYYPIVFDRARTTGSVTFLATAYLPPEAPKTEVVAWSVERENGSRSVSVLFPHFYENWQNDDLRKLVLNGILWSVGAEIPPAGIDSTLPSLETFEPKSVKPVVGVRK